MRVFLMIRMGFRELRRLVHPRGVIQTKLNRTTVSVDVINSVAGFVMVYLALFFVSVLLFGLSGYDFVTSLSVVGATLVTSSGLNISVPDVSTTVEPVLMLNTAPAVRLSCPGQVP